jgi:hypothetical protein
MDPGTGNVYTPVEAKALGIDTADLIELDPAEARRILDERIAEANALTATPTPPATLSSRDKARRRARNKAARRSRKANR